MPRRYPKKRGRGEARRAARQLRGKLDPSEARDEHPDEAGDGTRQPSQTDPAAPPAGDFSGASSSVSAEDHLDDHLLQDRRRTPSRHGSRDAAPVEPTFAGDTVRRAGRITGSASGCCWVTLEGETLLCALPSRLAAHQREMVAVGDHARISQAEDNAWWVTEILPRSTELSRPDPHNPRLRRVLAANVDLVVHVASVRKPPLVPALLDRFLIAIGESGAEPVIVINKCDLLSTAPPLGRLRATLTGHDDELASVEPHRLSGVPIILCAAKTGGGIDALREALAGRTAVLAGHSGVGKSSLVNALGGEGLAATGQVAGHRRSRGRGRHTTTRAAMLTLDDGIELIDTPGIRELGLWRFDATDLDRHFPEIAELGAHCRFRNCSHSHEPACAVQEAASTGTLEAERLDTYHRIRASLDDDPLRPR